MNSIAQMQADERAQLFAETADRKAISDAIVEKDFWVCWILKQLFSIDALSGRLLFKGGTSLSKVFHAINRFSEDIDLAVDYAALGFIGSRDPRQETLSKTKRATILAEMMTVCQQYIGGEFLDALKARCEELLGTTDTWSLDVSEHDRNVVRFRYPTAVAKGLAYVAPQVILELGTHAEFVPHGRFTIRSFAAEEFPQVVADGDVAVEALLAKRTFWEKATILHAEYYRPEERVLPDRYSRHYYDLAMLAQTPIRAEALSDMALLAQVVRHKETFYPSGWARYDLAHPGSLRLLPTEQRLTVLERDYRNMGVMIFGEPPGFDDIMATLEQLEQEMNRSDGV
ncbi:nucleotidyl transferase AbiEii/AbiGii toxin family protein [Acidicapsa ligni]|uniref:nucleotidyl transferase AbiEii/AbiGii toxin family protein n=1 Tax=Acidicapsa ligni TaxID=542300 RepID=UPI0021DF4C9F|nr:nucleotidyl transferase AbiEii/AbiGii toxin family protein [Acidicapsa ligni]